MALQDMRNALANPMGYLSFRNCLFFHLFDDCYVTMTPPFIQDELDYNTFIELKSCVSENMGHIRA